MPQSTDLVTDLPADFEVFGQAVATSMADLLGGTTGQVLKKNSNTDMDFVWSADAAGMTNPMTTTGDTIYSSSGSTPARLGIGSTGQVLTVSGGLPSWATPASGNITWTARSGLDNTPFQVAYNGTNLYVLVGGGGILYTSTDGITWTSRTSGFGTNSINSVAYGNGLFVAVGANGTITTSTDGITWTARTSNMGTNQINHVIYANSIWVAVGVGGGTTNTGGITYSTDGITWTRKSQSLTVGTTYGMVAWNGTNFVIGADVSTNNYLYASTPSGTWTVGNTGVSSGIYGLYWDGTRHIALYATGAAGYSTSTTLGTTTQFTNITNLQSSGDDSTKAFNYYYDGKIYSSVTAGNGGTNSDWSTTPFQTNYALTGTKYLSPGAIRTTTSRFLYVGPVGQIVFSGNMVYTSF